MVFLPYNWSQSSIFTRFNCPALYHSSRPCQGILKAPAPGYAVPKEFPVDMPIPAHLCPASELFACMISATQPAVMLHRACQRFFKRHTVYRYSSGKSFRTNVPMSTHRFDIRIMIAQMILTVDDDNNLLKYVAESMKVGGKQSRNSTTSKKVKTALMLL